MCSVTVCDGTSVHGTVFNECPLVHELNNGSIIRVDVVNCELPILSRRKPVKQVMGK